MPESWAKNQNTDASFVFCWSKQITRCTQIQTNKYRQRICGHFKFSSGWTAAAPPRPRPLRREKFREQLRPPSLIGPGARPSAGSPPPELERWGLRGSGTRRRPRVLPTTWRKAVGSRPSLPQAVQTAQAAKTLRSLPSHRTFL